MSRDALDELWNADELVGVRAAMARGEKPAACSAWWKHEARGGISRRLLNPVYRGLGGTLSVDALPNEGAASEYRLERRPDWFVLELGNVCNLKCRELDAPLGWCRDATAHRAAVRSRSRHRAH